MALIHLIIALVFTGMTYVASYYAGIEFLHNEYVGPIAYTMFLFLLPTNQTTVVINRLFFIGSTLYMVLRFM